MKKPLVSVLMTVYNREKYIAEAIESVLASSYTNFELIIVDDQSKDKSVEIAKNYEAKDNRIKVYINEKNLGDYPNRNQAASYAKGKYIKYLDSDDLIYPHGLQVMVEAMEQFPEAGVGFIYENYDNIHTLPVQIPSEEAFTTHFFTKGIFYMGPSATIFNREYFFKIGKFGNFGVANDYEFNMRAAIEKPIVLMHRDLIWWRQHEGQEYVKGNELNEYIIQNYLINKSVLAKIAINSDTQAKAQLNTDIQLSRKLVLLLLKLSFKRFINIKKATKFKTIKIFYAFKFSKKIN